MFDINASTPPEKPGIYLFKQSKKIIYVGKAKNLKNRVSQYKLSQGISTKTKAMLEKADELDFIVTKSEEEALLYENDLIKNFQPKYNILLKDDKSYPYIQLSNDEFPAIQYFRGKMKQDSRYFGPYLDKNLIKLIIDQIQIIFKLRTCSNSYFSNRSRPCMLFQINRCSAPCMKLISKTAYEESVKNAIALLEGNSENIVNEFVVKMHQLSAAMEFEKAAVIRDQVAQLSKVVSFKHDANNEDHLDVFYFDISFPVINVFYFAIRLNKIIASERINKTDIIESPQDEFVTNFILQFYMARKVRSSFSSLVVNIKPYALETLHTELTKILHSKTNIIYQPKKEKLKWLQMAKANCNFNSSPHDNMQLTTNFLSLAHNPIRIECFDISHTCGTNTVGACVVFINGVANRKLYRSYNINLATAGDDYAAIYEVVLRRYTNVKNNLQELPDLIIIDGGAGQLKSAIKALEYIDLINIVNVISISKNNKRKEGQETIHLKNGDKKYVIENFLACKLLLQARNEAHKYALMKHLKLRSDTSLGSFLLRIPGIGTKKRELILNKFTSIKNLENATTTQLVTIPGINTKLALFIIEYLQANKRK
jgi:excinuclease ABC subunit C